MEPGLGGQEKGATSEANSPTIRSQWSLALAARKSPLEPTEKGKHVVVAMEPGLGGQEKLRDHGAATRPCLQVAMEPGLGGQEKRSLSAGHRRFVTVAMEPGLGGQEKVVPMMRSSSLILSQWSLALAARKSSSRPRHGPPHDNVAMEPGLGGQEKQPVGAGVRVLLPVAMEPGLGGQEKGSRFFACLTTSIAHLRERWEPCGEAGGLQAAETRSKCVLTRGRALPGGGGGTGALAR